MPESNESGPEYVPLPAFRPSAHSPARPSPAAPVPQTENQGGVQAFVLVAGIIAVGATLIFASPRRASAPDAAPASAAASAAPAPTLAPPAESARFRSVTSPLEPIRALDPALNDTSLLVRGPNDGFEELGRARFAAAQANVGECKDCKQAIDGSGHAAVPAAGGVGGSMAYVGPCQDGFVYRVTNLRPYDMPPYLIGDNGEVWNVPGGIRYGQWVEIRSKTQIVNTISTYKP